MTDIMASPCVDFHLSNAKLSSLWAGNCLLIASTVSQFSIWHMMVRVVVDGPTRLLCNA